MLHSLFAHRSSSLEGVVKLKLAHLEISFPLCSSRIAVEAMRSLNPGVVTMALNNALWSREEEAVLARIPVVSHAHSHAHNQLLDTLTRANHHKK